MCKNEQLHHQLPVAIQRIKTDHGSECWTDFTGASTTSGSPPASSPRANPEPNARVERTHWTDEEEFSPHVTFRPLDDLQRKLLEWKHEYNHSRPHPALRGKPPAERFCEFRTATVPDVRKAA